MDAVNDAAVREVVVMKSAQIGWTELLNNIVGYFVHQDPAPILVIQPTLEMAQAWSKDRLAPMLRDTPALRDKVKDARSRDSNNTISHKQFAGGHLSIVGANSPSGLASRPIRVVLADEVDRYPASAGTEGDPLSLARKRTTTFWNRKICSGSTPTLAGESRIEAAFKASDQRYFMVPCPHCFTSQRLQWPNVKWPEGEPRKAFYACPHCGGVIGDRDKPAMLAAGEWVATATSDGVAGFHINELYSPWVSFGDTASAFVDAKALPETLQTWVNTALGEVWVDRGEVPTFDRVMRMRSDYASGDLPDGVLVITAGCDVQKDRIIYTVRGWGYHFASWLLEFGTVFGDTSETDVWQLLADVLSTEYGGQRIRLAMIDSGFRADRTYEFCRGHPFARPCKGQDTASIPVRSSKVDVSIRGTTIKQGQTIWHVDTSYFKTLIHGRIDFPQDQAGAWHLPSDISDDYAKQIIAESRITLPNGRTQWKRHDRENHALDCDVYASAAARIIGMDRVRQRPQQEQQQEAVPPPVVQQAVPQRRAYVLRGRFR